MNESLYRYQFREFVPMADVEAAMVLALLAAEFLHGETQVMLDASHYLDLQQRVCVMDGSTPVGSHLNRLFLGFLKREFGPDAFHVEKLRDWPAQADTTSDVM